MTTPVRKSVVLLSGGMDSTTLAYWAQSRGFEVIALSVYYGQRHAKEIIAAGDIVARLKCKHVVIDINRVNNGREAASLFSDAVNSSSLTSNEHLVPEGHYEDSNMKQTVVPNRNAIMLSLAFGIAIAEGAIKVSIAVHDGDHAIYPDCRPEFIASMDAALKQGMWGIAPAALEIEAPFLGITKAGIIAIGRQLNVHYEDTWTCYNGREHHCGRCATCVERQEAFYLNLMTDPVPYEDPEYWKTVSKVFNKG